MAEYQRIRDGLAPAVADVPEILLFGSFPSPKTRERGFHFGHPQNRFWPVLASVFGERIPETDEERKALINKHHLIIWNVIGACEIIGSKDASIRNIEVNPLDEMIKAYGIKRVFALGKKAEEVYNREILPKSGIPCRALPSPSPANRRYRMEDLIKAYREILLPESE